MTAEDTVYVNSEQQPLLHEHSSTSTSIRRSKKCYCSVLGVVVAACLWIWLLFWFLSGNAPPTGIQLGHIKPNATYYDEKGGRTILVGDIHGMLTPFE